MKIYKSKTTVHCCECEELKPSYRISHSDGTSMAYLCEKCLEELSHILNNQIADEWLKEETN